MKKGYIIPEMEIAPLQLNACIMSGEGNSPSEQGHVSGPGQGELGAPSRRVYY